MCFGVGQYYHQGYIDLVERWNGQEWSQEAAPEVGSFQGGWGRRISCTTTESCTLVGNYELHHGGPWVSGVPRGNGHTWTSQATPSAASAENLGLSDVSCVGEAGCAAVGIHVEFYAKERAETRAETTMATKAPPVPTGATKGALAGTSCATSTSCIAVGSYNSSEGTFGLAEEWTGLEWKKQAPPTPSGGTLTELHHVSCTGPSECTAVGSYKNSSGTIVTLAERLSGSGWQVQSTPNPLGAQESRLSGVSCTSASSCVAVGFAKSKSGALEGFSETFNGSEWTLKSTPAPSGATASRLLDVACAAAGSCTAVGSYTNASGETLTLAESYNGSVWEVQTTPNPEGAKSAELDAISCPAQESCTAVGSYTNASGKSEAFAEGYNGSEWQLQSLEAPSGATATSLSGITCTALGACVAVGSSTSTGGAQTPLAELWSGYQWPSDARSHSRRRRSGRTGLHLLHHDLRLRVGRRLYVVQSPAAAGRWAWCSRRGCETRERRREQRGHPDRSRHPQPVGNPLLLRIRRNDRVWVYCARSQPATHL